MYDAFYRDLRIVSLYRRVLLRTVGDHCGLCANWSPHYSLSRISEEGFTLTDDEWEWLESLPRVTLAERVRYWDARHFLEQPRASLARAYVGSVQNETYSGRHRSRDSGSYRLC